MQQVQSASDIVTKLIQDSEFATAVKANPVAAIGGIAAPMSIPDDNWIYRIVVGSLGLVVLVTVFGGIYLASADKSLPEGIVALGSAAVGALAGILAPSPTRG